MRRHLATGDPEAVLRVMAAKLGITQLRDQMKTCLIEAIERARAPSGGAA